MKTKLYLLIYIAIVLMVSDIPNPVYVAVAPYKFNIVLWEYQNFFTQSKEQFARNYCLGSGAELYDSAMFSQRTVSSSQRDEFIKLILKESILNSGFDSIFPPLNFSIEKAPNILIMSPRDNIFLEKTILLTPSINIDQIIDLEEEVENLTGNSILIDELGGLAVYPSIINDNNNVVSILETAAHEWVHHRLILTPLGRRYFGNAFMKELNENVAQLAGNELARKASSFIPECNYGSDVQVTTNALKGHREFLGLVRDDVEAMLKAGSIEQAEKYMEDQRIILAKSGYVLRKLNQAYYAFHGMYGDDPVASSGIYAQLLNLRSQSQDLHSFISLIGDVTDKADYHSLIDNY